MPRSDHWTAREMPDQSGRTAVVTGATSGIGFETAKVLAEHGATVVLTGRDLQKATDAAGRIRGMVPEAQVEVAHLDLASLSSIRAFAEALTRSHQQVDLLINNAGVMVPPYGRTADGFELQFGTNHLGHFALTGLLLERLRAARDARVVTVSSSAHLRGRINFDDLQSERRYSRQGAYGQSKLANMLFTYELQRRFEAAGADTIAVAAHPGWARTELQRHAPGQLWWTLMSPFGVFFSQSAERGALPTLRAATDPGVKGGEYYGPSGFMEATGDPVRVKSSARSLDAGLQHQLWEVSERLTGVTYRF